MEIEIREADWSMDEAAAVALLSNYADELADRLPETDAGHVASQRAELTMLRVLWAEPKGTMLLAFADGVPAGCVTLKIRTDRVATTEMKRLWVEPFGRGYGLGKKLALAALAWSRERGYKTVVLDTQPDAMPEAVRLYRGLGFAETAAHNDNPVGGLAYFKLEL